MSTPQGMCEVLDRALRLSPLALCLAKVIDNRAFTGSDLDGFPGRSAAGAAQDLNDQSIPSQSTRLRFCIHQTEQIIRNIDRICHCDK